MDTKLDEERKTRHQYVYDSIVNMTLLDKFIFTLYNNHRSMK
jgi:hypothetical protein